MQTERRDHMSPGPAGKSGASLACHRGILCCCQYWSSTTNQATNDFTTGMGACSVLRVHWMIFLESPLLKAFFNVRSTCHMECARLFVLCDMPISEAGQPISGSLYRLCHYVPGMLPCRHRAGLVDPHQTVASFFVRRPSWTISMPIVPMHLVPSQQAVLPCAFPHEASTLKTTMPLRS